MISMMGTWMQITAQGFLIYDITRSPAYLGYIGFASGLPTWIFMLYGGVIADRFSKRRTLMITQTIMMLLAAVLGVAAAAMVFSFLRNAGPEKVQMVEGVAAASNIPANTQITADMLKMSEFPRELGKPDQPASPAMVVGKFTVAEIKAGDQILPSGLSDSPNDFSALVPPGMRAVTIALDQVIGVGGFLRRGNRVDVIATYDRSGDSYTRTVLQDVELLALGSEISYNEGSAKSDKMEGKSQPTATLAVMPHEAEKLMFADSEGKLRLALRRFDDKSVVVTRALPVGGSSRNSTSDNKQPRGASGQTERRDPIISDIKITSLPPITLTGPDGKPLTTKLGDKQEGTHTIEIIRGTEKTVTVVSE